ncbi:MAG TPA: peptidyl-prolyl cis-trans isomerase [Vicinamibacterales bacterium]|jgi:peptidyl-prolyl cis-trans isomerase D
MTMLDRMRRHKNWLKWSLAIVVVAFVALYIPSFLRNSGTEAGPNGVVATVDGRDITVNRFRRAYVAQMNMYRNAYGGNVDENLLKQLGVDQRIVQQLIEEESALAEAGRQGISASNAEVRARILSLPAFQENGQFIGQARYEQILDNQNPPIRASEFEEEVRRSIIVEKLQGALTDWITVSDTDVDAEFTRRNEKVKLSVVSFFADKFKDGVTLTDAEIASHFESNKEKYRIPEKRKIKYALVDTDAIRQRITVTDQDIKQHYDSNIAAYSTPEEMQASHILLKTTEGKDEAAVKQLAEETLAKVKGGADFAALAKKVSEDTGSAVKGGDLGFFPRGRMVKEFADAAWALKPGEISGLVKSEFGYHIIKAGEKKPATTSSMEAVRPQIEDTLKYERASKEAERISNELAGKLPKPSDLDTVAKPRGLIVAESGFFGRGEPIAGLGDAREAVDRAFELKDGEVSEALRTPSGLAFITVTAKQDSRVPALDEVKARVRDDLQKKKAMDLARQKASGVVAQLKAGDFAAAAKAAGLEAKPTDFVARNSTIPDIGMSPAVDAAAFSLPQGGVSDPITTDNGAVIVKVLEKKGPTPDEVKNGRETVKNELLNQQRQRFFTSYMTKARERMTIRSNPQVLAQVVG